MNPKAIPKIVIFDWDGTLVNSRNYIIQCANQVFKHYGSKSWDTLKKLGIADSQKPFKKNLEVIFGASFQEAFKTYTTAYLSHFKNYINIAAGALELVDFFAKHQCTINIASNKDSSLLQQEVKHFFPNHKFKNVLGYDDCNKHKPHPWVVETICKPYKNLNRNTQVIFIGDSETDLKCAKASGCFPIIIDRKKHTVNLFSQVHHILNTKYTSIEKG